MFGQEERLQRADVDKPYMSQVENQNIPGGDYKSFELKPSETCQVCIDACLNDPNCKAYTYVKPGVQRQNAVCWLKSSISNPVVDQNCISGIKSIVKGQPAQVVDLDQPTIYQIGEIIKQPVQIVGLDQPTITQVENQNIPGGDYKSFELKPGETCQVCIDACLNDPNCKAYTYVKPGVQRQNAVCWLKTSVSNPVVDLNCISGVKTTVKEQTRSRSGTDRTTTREQEAPRAKRASRVQIDREIETDKDVAVKRQLLPRPYPDSLQIGAYTIVAEAYDTGSVWNRMTKVRDHLSGKGWIKFNCPVSDLVYKNIWKGAVMKSVSFKVAKNPSGRENEISARDIALLGIPAQAGSEVELMIPHYNGKAIEMSRYIKEMVSNKKPDGIHVRFTNLSVKVNNPGDKKGLVLSGNAEYITEQDLPTAPFTLNIHPGFQLEVSAVTFFPDLDPLINARLLLPPSLTKINACTRGNIDLGNIRISSNCEFYMESPAAGYGVFAVGNSTLAINGNGYILDFSSSQKYVPSGKTAIWKLSASVDKPESWKGVILLHGESKGSPSGTAVSNIGYLQAPYSFSNGIIESSGLSATFNLASTSSYLFETIQPYGYVISFKSATVNVASSQVSGGTIKDGTAKLPYTAIRLADDMPVVLSELNLIIKPSMDLIGIATIRPETSVYWGDLIASGGGDRKSFGIAGIQEARIYFAAQPRTVFNPTTADGKTFDFPDNPLSDALLESLSMQGATFNKFTELVINTRDAPDGSSWDPNKPAIAPSGNKVRYKFRGNKDCWINVVTEGVHCNLDGIMTESPDLKLGDNSKPLYVGITPFEIKSKDDKEPSSIILQCIESAVINCDYQAYISMAEPVNTVMDFIEMVFTSTGDNAGGKLTIEKNDSLSYWGLGLVQKPGFESAGLVSVKTGQIIMTAAGLSEKRHFAEPFWLTWGEMLANGSMGRLFFDFNSAGQQFDHFNFVHNAVALSPIDPSPYRKGFLRVGGTAYFPFFGGDYLHIIDAYDTNKPDFPHNKRVIRLSNETLTDFMPSDLTINGNWSDGLGIFNFTLKYNDASQDGFSGKGPSAIRYLSGGGLSSDLEMNSRGTCIYIGSPDLMDQRSVTFGSIANLSNITRIWGCVCFKGDCIENMVVGGEVTESVNASIAVRGGASLIAILQVTPALTRFTLDGVAYLSTGLSFDAMVNGHMQLTRNHNEGFVEGEISGKFRVAEGAGIIGSSLEAEGQVNWHFGGDFWELQGMVSLEVLGFGGGSGVGAGIYIGRDAPTRRASVLYGTDPRYKLRLDPFGETLTGFYGFVKIHEGINLYVISGGYDLYIGAGILNTAVVGNIGGRIYGDILGGLVSASAALNIQINLGSPMTFHGMVELQACVLWIFCGSVDLTLGLNSETGFYIE